jgi:hypothetical protein
LTRFHRIGVTTPLPGFVLGKWRNLLPLFEGICQFPFF